MQSKFEYQFELLKQEIDVLQTSIRNYDSMVMEVKKWAVAIYSGFLVIKLNSENAKILAYGLISIFLFWLIDSILKSIQGCYIKRFAEIERFLNSEHFRTSIDAGEIKSIQVPDISSQFRVTPKNKIRDIMTHGFRFHNYLLYLAMLVLSGILWLTVE